MVARRPLFLSALGVLTLAILLLLASFASSMSEFGSPNICAVSSGGSPCIGMPCSKYPPKICGGGFVSGGADIGGSRKPACI